MADEPNDRPRSLQIAFVSTLFLVGGLYVWTRLPDESLLGQSVVRPLTVATLLFAFWVSELFVARVAVRTGSHSFSPSDLALICGILIVPPKAVAFAAVAGLGVSLAFRLSSAPMRIFFNVGQTAFSSSSGLTVAALLADGHTDPSTRVWMAAMAGGITAAAIGSLAVDIAVTISDGRAQLLSFGRSLAFSAAASLGAGSLGVLVVWASRIDRSVLALVLPPMGITFLALRASLQQKQNREEVEFLYGALRALSNERDIARGLTIVSKSLRDTLRAKDVTISLHAPAGWHVLDEDEQRLCVAETPLLLPEQGARCESEGNGLVLRRRIDGSEGVLGLVEVGMKSIGRSGFDRHDQHRLDQLADQLGVHLENSGLSRSLAQLEQAEAMLRAQVETDHLTGLNNRAWLHEQSRHVSPRAVVLIDLDGFKAVNDTLGHEAGDRVLSAVGKQLQAIIPDGWTAVRLGGDEFAVVTFAATKAERTDVEELVTLIEESSIQRDLVRSDDVRLGASAGAAIRSRDSDDLDELLRRADSAMYAAKRARKHRSTEERGTEARASETQASEIRPGRSIEEPVGD